MALIYLKVLMELLHACSLLRLKPKASIIKNHDPCPLCEMMAQQRIINSNRQKNAKKTSITLPKPTPSLVGPSKQPERMLPAPQSQKELSAPATQLGLPKPQNIQSSSKQNQQRPNSNNPQQPLGQRQQSLPSTRQGTLRSSLPSTFGSQHPEQRVGVFVDLQNMYYSGKQLYNAKVNFAAILKEAVKGRKLVRAIAYVIRADNPEEQVFFDVLGNMGYEVKTKELQIFPGGAKKADWDIGIAMDAIELAPKLDTVILVSGDGDFVPLLQHLRRAMGCRVEVIAFGKSSSQKLREEADSFVDLEANVSLYLMK